MYELISLALIGISIALLVLAIIWETGDYMRLQKRPPLSEIDEEDQEDELIFYGCFNRENNAYWKHLYIIAWISTGLIWAALWAFDIRVDLNFNVYASRQKPSFLLIVLIFVIILLISYIVTNFRQFHLYRVMCSKIKEDNVIF